MRKSWPKRSDYALIVIIFALIIISCLDKNLTDNEVKQALAPQVSSNNETGSNPEAAFTTNQEVLTWVSKSQHCLVIGKWSCLRNYGNKLITLDDAILRAFGSWTLGLFKMHNEDYSAAFRFFGLAVRDNPNRVAFHKWFSLSAFMIKQWEVSKRHAQWAILQPESQNDSQLYVLSKLQDNIIKQKEKSPESAKVIMRTLREPSGGPDHTLKNLWSKSVFNGVKTHCSGKKKPSYCN